MTIQQLPAIAPGLLAQHLTADLKLGGHGYSNITKPVSTEELHETEHEIARNTPWLTEIYGGFHTHHKCPGNCGCEPCFEITRPPDPHAGIHYYVKAEDR